MGTLSQHSVPNSTGRRPQTWPARRVAGLLTGLVILAGSIGLIGAAAYTVVASTSDTYLDLGAHGTYRTDRYALATDSTNWRTTWFGWAGSVRLEVASTGDKPIFVGVAPPDRIDRYLAGTGYTTVAEHTGHGIVRTDHDGTAPAIPPTGTVDWTAHAQGAGTQTLRWNANDGPQIVYAANADGSRPVGVQIVSSAITLDRMPWWVPAGLFALGIVLLPPGALMLRRTVRAPRAVA